MSTWYLLSVPAWLFLMATAAARLADMSRDQWSRMHHVRRLATVLVAAGSAAMIATGFAEDAARHGPITWKSCLLAYGFAGVWLTTPGLPPWYDFILGVHRDTDAWKTSGYRVRARGEIRALRASFQPRHRRAKP